MRVAVIMGSTSDLPKVEPAIKILKDYGVQVDVRCLSAHRAHAGLSAFIEEANGNGTEVFITAAGMAAALPGVVASQTVLPVIGVPISGSVLDGQDALYSIVQMPSGIPVATVAINGAKNAAYLALQIIGVQHKEVQEKLLAERKQMEESAMKANEEVIAKYNKDKLQRQHQFLTKFHFTLLSLSSIIKATWISRYEDENYRRVLLQWEFYRDLKTLWLQISMHFSIRQKIRRR